MQILTWPWFVSRMWNTRRLRSGRESCSLHGLESAGRSVAGFKNRNKHAIRVLLLPAAAHVLWHILGSGKSKEEGCVCVYFSKQDARNSTLTLLQPSSLHHGRWYKNSLWHTLWDGTSSGNGFCVSLPSLKLCILWSPLLFFAGISWLIREIVIGVGVW